jgi:hypothetical protein
MLHAAKGDRAASMLGDLAASFQHLRAPRPERAPGMCADTPLDPTARALPLDPTGARLAPGPPHKAASRDLALLAQFGSASFSLKFNSAALRGI